MTEGIGTTQLFRMKLRELRNKGPSGLDGPGTQNPSETSDARNFDLFLRLNALWDEIEEVRDMHHERWPIFIGRTERFEEAGRQVIAR